MIASPLVTTTLFSVGPVAITTPVVVTWGLMAAIGGASFFATRSLAIKPSAWQAALELFLGAIDQPDPRYDPRCTAALCASARYIVSLHSGRELVFADSGD